MRFLRFRRWLDEVTDLAGGLDMIVYEQVRRHAGTDASHAYGGWLAILSAWCEQNSIAYDITDPWLRQAITNKANRRWGRRNGGNDHGR